MENTLEIRWFIKGKPSRAVVNWFRFNCPGEFKAQEPEEREDWYFYRYLDNWGKLKILTPNLTQYEQFNLKLRQGNIELKLRKQELGTQQFGNIQQPIIWEGNIEKWCKLTEQELEENDFLNPNSLPENGWILVEKKREQRIDRGVESELTWLKINNDFWWSVAFEMSENHHRGQKENCFQEVIDRACSTYNGPQLLAENSYSYSRWLLISMNKLTFLETD